MKKIIYLAAIIISMCLTSVIVCADSQPASTNYTVEVSKWVLANKYENIPSSVTDRMKVRILDAIGCGIHGSTLPAVQKAVQAYADKKPNSSDAIVWGTDKTARTDMAALLNGTAIQSDELDEAGQETHSTASNLSSLLAASEELGNVDGKTFLNEMVIGQEVLFRMANAFTAKGFVYQDLHYHQAGVLSPAGTVAALAQIYNLNQEQTFNAFGLACNRGFALEITRVSSDDKRMMQARGGMSGIQSVELAKTGFTGIENVFETQYGFYQFFTQSSDKYDAQQLTYKLGTVWDTPLSELKRYSGMIFQHAHYYCAKQLMDEYKFSAKDIKKVEVMVSPLDYEHSNHVYNRTDSKTFAQFCIPYGVAVMFLYGNTFVEEYTPDKLVSKDVMALTQKIQLVVNDKWPRTPVQTRPSKVTVYLNNGKVYEKSIEYGASVNPMTTQEVINKFNILTKPVYNEKRRNQIINMVMNLEQLDNMNKLAALLKN